MISALNKKTVQQRWINDFLTELYKYLDDLSVELMNELFYLHQYHCNLYI